MYNSMSLHDKVMREYEKLRDFNKREIIRANNELYEKIPQIKSIDDEISALTIKYASKVATGELTPEEAVLCVEKRKNELTENRNSIINNSGEIIEIPSMYSCDKCSDTGYIGKDKCSCYLEIMKKVMLSEVNGATSISFDFDKDTFDNFSLEWYSKIKDEKLKISPYDNMKMVLRDCKLFCFDFKKQGGNLFFYGKSGTGKTFMANCIANDLIRQGCNIVYQSAYKLFQFMEDYKFCRINRENNIHEFESIYNSDLLIIDDLGTEFMTAYTCSVFFDILNTRLLNGKSTIINTNLSIGNLEEKYTERVASRIKGYFEMMPFIGDDIRVIKKINGR